MKKLILSLNARLKPNRYKWSCALPMAGSYCRAEPRFTFPGGKVIRCYFSQRWRLFNFLSKKILKFLNNHPPNPPDTNDRSKQMYDSVRPRIHAFVHLLLFFVYKICASSIQLYLLSKKLVRKLWRTQTKNQKPLVITSDKTQIISKPFIKAPRIVISSDLNCWNLQVDNLIAR